MKNPAPEISLSRTPTGALLHLRMEVPAGYVLQAPPTAHAAESARVVIQWHRDKKVVSPHMQELFVSLPALSHPSVEVEVRDADGKRVGGGAVVILEEADDK